MSSLPINPSLANIQPYQPGRPIEEVARELNLPAADIIKLASNENPLGPSPMALAAMEKALHQLHLYPDGNAFYLKQKLARNLGVEPENLVLGNGSNEIIEFVGHALMKPGVDVVVSQYCFAVYPIVTHLLGANLITVPAAGYGHDLPAMLEAVTPNTRVMFVANPNNPTGTLAPGADIDAIIAKILDDHQHLARTRANNSRGLDCLQDSFRQLGLEFIPSHANFVLVRVGDGQRVFEEMQRLRVITRPMTSYHLPEWIRITVGTPEQNTRCIVVLKKVLASD